MVRITTSLCLLLLSIPVVARASCFKDDPLRAAAFATDTSAVRCDEAYVQSRVPLRLHVDRIREGDEETQVYGLSIDLDRIREWNRPSRLTSLIQAWQGRDPYARSSDPLPYVAGRKSFRGARLTFNYRF